VVRKLSAGAAVAAMLAFSSSLIASASFPDTTNLIPINPTTNLYDPLLVGTLAQVQQTNDCQAVLAHQPTGNLTKAFSSSHNNGDGTTTYFYTVTTTRGPSPPTTYADLVDCGQAVNSSNMYRTETASPSFNASGSTTVTLTVATSDDVCDRVHLTGTDQSGAFDDYSNEVGVSGGVENAAICQPQTTVPEAPWGALFVPIGFGALGAAWFVNRRRSLDLAA
jgi:hypothetical protein